jgi:hypothetical protein
MECLRRRPIVTIIIIIIMDRHVHYLIFKQLYFRWIIKEAN